MKIEVERVHRGHAYAKASMEFSPSELSEVDPEVIATSLARSLSELSHPVPVLVKVPPPSPEMLKKLFEEEEDEHNWDL